MDKISLLEQLLPLEIGRSAYVEGDIQDIRSALASYDNFVVALWSHGQCKVTKIKTKQESFYGGLAEQMGNYIGTPIVLENDTQKVRMAVSRYNKLNGTSFSVRSLGANRVEVYSESLTDFKFISQDRFDGYVERVQEEIEQLRSRVRPDQFFRDAEIMDVDFEDEDEHQEHEEVAHSPSQPPARTERITDTCPECGDEFFRQGTSPLCGDCQNELV